MTDIGVFARDAIVKVRTTKFPPIAQMATIHRMTLNQWFSSNTSPHGVKEFSLGKQTSWSLEMKLGNMQLLRGRILANKLG